jgi:hypothetical protein
VGRHILGTEFTAWEKVNVCSSPNIVKTVTLRRMRWSAHVARMREIEIRTTIWSEKLKGTRHVEDNIKMDV